MTNQSVSTSEQGPYPKISRVADDFIRAVGHYACWLNVVLILVILAQVTLRYGFGRGQIILEEIQWHLYAIAVMFAISYGVVTDAHIRMDIIYSSSTRKTKEWIEVFGSERLTGALLDRLTHRCHILEANGESYRLQEAKKRSKSKLSNKNNQNQKEL